MEILSRLLMKILKDNKRRKRWRTFSMTLAACVVFVTTYSLILPAITIDTETAETMAGFDSVLLDDEADLEDQTSSSAGQEPGETISDDKDAGVSEEEDAGVDFDSLFEDEEEAEERPKAMLYSERAVKNVLINKIEKHYGKPKEPMEVQAKIEEQVNGRSVSEIMDRLLVIKKFI